MIVQLGLGVEAWLSKFGAGNLLPELQAVTVGQAVVRVAHVLIGSWILATSVVLTLLLYRPAVAASTQTEADLYARSPDLATAAHLERTA